VQWLNYHHLHYFWLSAREGSVTAAAKKLRLAQPTVSEQIRQLEEAVGRPLFERKRRGITLTETGRTVFDYAEEIFGLGRELADVLEGGRPERRRKLVIGLTDALPKLVVRRLIAPALALPEPLQLVCREERIERLLAELSIHAIDMVLSDSPLTDPTSERAFNHLLGESTVSFFATAKLAKRCKGRFPRSLQAAPLLVPTAGSPLRVALESWWQAAGIEPVIVGEFDDPALATAFGHAGLGVFPAPTLIEREIVEQYGVVVVGRSDAIRERFYVISSERRIRHPGVSAVVASARKLLV
jgi:LysR family transcriptional activator of nhaA